MHLALTARDSLKVTNDKSGARKALLATKLQPNKKRNSSVSTSVFSKLRLLVVLHAREGEREREREAT